MKRLLVNSVLFYQKFISPWLGCHCRFYPSCSEWMRQAIETYGVFIGFWLSFKRLLCCHPFHPGGYAPLRRKTL